MQITPINEAESILDPFWDQQLSGLKHWTVRSDPSTGMEVKQGWCWVTFEWVRRPAAGPALHMARTMEIDCSGYDALVLSVMAPEQSVVRLAAQTDRGLCRMEAPPAGTKKQELVLDLQGGVRLTSVTIEVEAGRGGMARGWFNWLGLQHSGRLGHMLQRQSTHDSNWEHHLRKEDVEPSFKPVYGLVLNEGELQRLHERHQALTVSGAVSPFVEAAVQAARIQPEMLIHDYVNFWSDSRYNRERDHGRHMLTHGLNAAIAGHLLRDKTLLRLAARYALSIGMCGHWDDGFICRFPGSTFEHRCFVQNLCAHEVAGILDLAGECFTDLGRDFLLRRLAEEAIGTIQYNTWKHDYIFDCNQLAWFTPGRMLSLAVLERHWPRVRSYLDIAYDELCESLERSILPDGGYAEGPTYFRCVGRDAGLGVYYYGRATGQPLSDLIPEPMKRCAAFAETLISTDDQADVIPVCDAGNRHEFLSQTIMAGLLPGSAWSRMARKSLERAAGWPFDRSKPPAVALVPAMVDAAIAWNLAESLSPTDYPPAVFSVLPAMGPVTSTRRTGGQEVKLFIQGNHGGAGHTHEDKGSFVLEFAGETFAMDPGTCDYSHPLSGELKNCERHNMLVPYGLTERPHPECPLSEDVKSVGSGDAAAFQAMIDATPGWKPYYRYWHRTWESPSPEDLTITDEYELLQGDGVEFCWQTRLPVTIEGCRAVIEGQRGKIEIKSPFGAPWRLDELPLLNGIQYRLVFQSPLQSARLVTVVRLVHAAGLARNRPT